MANVTHQDIAKALGVRSISDVRLDFSRATLHGPIFDRAEMMNARFNQARIRGTFSNADIRNSILDSVRFDDSIFTDATLLGASMDGANLAGVDLSGANLMRANLTEAVLQNVDFSGADLRNVLGMESTRKSRRYW